MGLIVAKNERFPVTSARSWEYWKVNAIQVVVGYRLTRGCFVQNLRLRQRLDVITYLIWQIYEHLRENRNSCGACPSSVVSNRARSQISFHSWAQRKATCQGNDMDHLTYSVEYMIFRLDSVEFVGTGLARLSKFFSDDHYWFPCIEQDDHAGKDQSHGLQSWQLKPNGEGSCRFLNTRNADR